MDNLKFRTALDNLGMSQASASRFLNVSERTVRRMATNEAPVPTYIEMLLNILVAHNISPAEAVAKFTNPQTNIIRSFQRRKPTKTHHPRRRTRS